MLRTSPRQNRPFLGVVVSVAATFVALACGPGDRPALESGTCVPTETSKCAPPLVAGQGPGVGGGGAPAGDNGGDNGGGAAVDDAGAGQELPIADGGVATGFDATGAVNIGVDFPDLDEIFTTPMSDGGGAVVP